MGEGQARSSYKALLANKGTCLFFAAASWAVTTTHQLYLVALTATLVTAPCFSPLSLLQAGVGPRAAAPAGEVPQVDGTALYLAGISLQHVSKNCGTSLAKTSAHAMSKLGLAKAITATGLRGDKSPKSDAVAVYRLALSLLDKCDAADAVADFLKSVLIVMRDQLPDGIVVKLDKRGNVELRRDLDHRVQERFGA